MIKGLEGQMNIKFSHGLFHLEMKGITFGLSQEELETLQALTQIMLQDFSKSK